MIELTKDEMINISGGLGLFDTTAWTLGALSDALSVVNAAVIGVAVVAFIYYSGSGNGDWPHPFLG